MAQAPQYNRDKNFTDNSGDRTDHAALDAELDNVSASINALQTNQAALQRDDGTLAHETVGYDQLTTQARQGLATPGPKGDKGDKGDAGATGPKGDKGDKGDIGASFNADALALFSQRSTYDTQPQGFSFLALDNGMLYFKLSAASGDWSTGYAFGKGAKGDKGDIGPQGPIGLTGLRGEKGDTGPAGPTGATGPAGVVDYTKVIRNDQVSSQTMQGSLNLQSLSASQSVTAQSFIFSQDTRLDIVSGRLRVATNQAVPQLKGVQASTYLSSGNSASNTGFLISTGADIGSLFDPAGSAASKLATVDPTPLVIDITGKTSLTLTLSVVGTEIKLAGSAA